LPRPFNIIHNIIYHSRLILFINQTHINRHGISCLAAGSVLLGFGIKKCFVVGYALPRLPVFKCAGIICFTQHSGNFGRDT
jgi:hypothetical protein